jgi:hypothetical protein
MAMEVTWRRVRPLQGCCQKHGAGHRADAAGHGGDPAGHFLHAVEIDVAGELAVRLAVHAHVDDDRAGLDHVGGQEVELADGSDDHVGLPRDGAQVLRGAVADGHGGALGQQHHGHRLADDVAAADDHRVLAAQVVADGFEHLHAAVRRAGPEAGGAGHQRAGAGDVEAVHVLGGRDGLDDLLAVHVLRKRQLHQDAVHLRVVVERTDAGQQVGFAHVGGVGLQRGLQARLRAVVDLVLRVDLAGRVLAHEDDGKSRVHATGLERGGAACDFGADGFGEGVAVDQLGGHRFRFSK